MALLTCEDLLFHRLDIERQHRMGTVEEVGIAQLGQNGLPVAGFVRRFEPGRREHSDQLIDGVPSVVPAGIGADRVKRLWARKGTYILDSLTPKR